MNIAHIKHLKQSGIISKQKYNELLNNTQQYSSQQQQQQHDNNIKTNIQQYAVDTYTNDGKKQPKQEQTITKDINTFFDKIYLLNLDTRPDRLVKMQERFRENNIKNYVRFPAIDGRDSKYNKHFNSLKYFFETRGAYGVLLSMYYILTNAIQNGYRSILIFEDDAVFHHNFTQIFNNQMKHISADWKLLYLGSSMHTWRIASRCVKRNGFLIPNGTVAGAFALGISYKCFPYLLKQIIAFKSAWDLAPLKTINQLFKNQCYVIYPNIVVADPRDSNIRNGKTLEKKANDCGWILTNYNFT